ncbi:MAG: ABC transporter substrate-binding protein [Acetobacteraceae bacterium]
MAERDERGRVKLSRRSALAGAGGFAALAALPASVRAAPSGTPVKIGIVAEASSVQGKAIANGAQMAADALNAKGGVLGRPLKLVIYDDRNSAADAVRAFQRLANQDKVAVVIGCFASEVALALEPWSARLKIPFIDSGAASNNIADQVHKDYDRFKYTFQGWLNASFRAESVCDSARDLLVGQLHMKSCVILSEDADWTTPLDAAYLEFLPKDGLKVVDQIRFALNTTDFTPIFNKIEAKKPDVIMTGLSHVGVVPTVQWAEARVPIPMYGVNGQASSSTFWKDTHGAAEGSVSQAIAGPGSAITPKTVPFTDAYRKRFGALPPYTGYSTHDMVFVAADAIKRAGSTKPDAIVTALEATDHFGTMGRIKFYGRKGRFTHGLEYGVDLVPGVMLQWQQAKIKTIWPAKFADAKISFPNFVKLPG